MKRVISTFLSLALLLALLCMSAYADTGGSGNIDGGGGSMGDATSHGSWNPGNDGVRVTVVRPVTMLWSPHHLTSPTKHHQRVSIISVR